MEFEITAGVGGRILRLVMEVEGAQGTGTLDSGEFCSRDSNSNSKRWNHMRKILERPSPFTYHTFNPSYEYLTALQEYVRVLVVGAGGLGCELLKNLVLLGFRNVDIIDMDTIDISNLNRQFLFRPDDVGKSKAHCAAAFVNKRVEGANVIAHHCKIQDKDVDFYKQFHVVVCGLDSITARKWLNSLIVTLDVSEEDEKIPFVDGGTEGFKGNVRVIRTPETPCVECNLDLYPPQINFPMCTLASTPRLPEHCIEYVRLLLWEREKPFGETPIDGDCPQHISWIYEKAQERAAQFRIDGITYRLTQGVVKNIIPAVASTNAVIAAACSTEVLKLVTGCSRFMDNFMLFNDLDGIYTFTYSAERKKNCLACDRGEARQLFFSKNVTVQEVYNYLVESKDIQMKSPGIQGYNKEGVLKNLYMKNITTEENLKKSLHDFEIPDGGEIQVADPTFAVAVSFKITYE
ncbi:unnamed protein product [Allacma fusca]|uniref:NEDD8-activating enzyme E1 catalytic subunit n=1 Tax=Allacma fusca TaxID=39272 RepID=A0A8J2KQ29_9HEXA|nr:unnamed protein product [Allacma fusca]